MFQLQHGVVPAFGVSLPFWFTYLMERFAGLAFPQPPFECFLPWNFYHSLLFATRVRYLARGVSRAFRCRQWPPLRLDLNDDAGWHAAPLAVAATRGLSARLAVHAPG